MTRWPRAGQLGANEAGASLHLVGALRDWLADIEPRLIGAARAQGFAWSQLAPVLRVGDRRAARRAAAALQRAACRGG